MPKRIVLFLFCSACSCEVWIARHPNTFPRVRMTRGWKFMLSCLWLRLVVCRTAHSFSTSHQHVLTERESTNVRFAPECFLSDAPSATSVLIWRRSPHLCLRPRNLSSPIRTFLQWLLLVAGDVEANPGPTRRPNWKFPCGVCDKPVKSNQRGIQCEVCYSWLHVKCINMSSDDYSQLQVSDEPWCCNTCLKEALPFFDTSDSDSIFNASTSSLTNSVFNTTEVANSCLPPHPLPPNILGTFSL